MLETLKRSLPKEYRFTIARVGGVALEVRSSFFLLPIWAAGMGLFVRGAGIRGAAFMVALVLLLYLGALLHELGHVIPARRFGATVDKVSFSYLGAFVQVRHETGLRPYQSLLIALGGPAASALLSLALYQLTLRVMAAHQIRDFTFIWGDTSGLALLLVVTLTNILLTVFNLLPVFPMDGGQALHSGLAFFLKPQQATRLVSAFGQFAAVAAVALVIFFAADPLVKLFAFLTAGLTFLVSFREARSNQRSPEPGDTLPA